MDQMNKDKMRPNWTNKDQNVTKMNKQRPKWDQNEQRPKWDQNEQTKTKMNKDRNEQRPKWTKTKMRPKWTKKDQNETKMNNKDQNEQTKTKMRPKWTKTKMMPIERRCPAPLVPAAFLALATSKILSHRGPAVQSTIARSLPGYCHSRDTPTCCRVTSVVFSDA